MRTTFITKMHIFLAKLFVLYISENNEKIKYFCKILSP